MPKHTRKKTPDSESLRGWFWVVCREKGGGPSWPGSDPALRHGSGALSLRGIVGPNPWVRCGECFSLRQRQYPLPILLILVSPLTVPAVSCCCRRLPPFFSAMPSCIERASCAESSLAVRGSTRPGRLAKIRYPGPASLPNAPRPSWRPAKNLDSILRSGCLRCASLKERRARVGRTRLPELADPLPVHPARTSCPPYDPSASWPGGLPALCIQARVHDARLDAG